MINGASSPGHQGPFLMGFGGVMDLELWVYGMNDNEITSSVQPARQPAQRWCRQKQKKPRERGYAIMKIASSVS